MSDRRFLAETGILLLTIFLLVSSDTIAQTRREIGSTRSSGTREAPPPAASPRDDGRNAKPASQSPAPSPQPSSAPPPALIPVSTGGVMVDAPIPPTMPVPAPSPGASYGVVSPIREVELSNRYEFPGFAGYDFSGEEVVSFSAGDMDMFFESSGDQHRMHVSTDTDIQDLGPASSVRENLRVREGGWSVTRSVAVEPGHQYLVWLWDGSSSKFFVKDAWSGGVLLDWVPGQAFSRLDRGGSIFPK